MSKTTNSTGPDREPPPRRMPDELRSSIETRINYAANNAELSDRRYSMVSFPKPLRRAARLIYGIMRYLLKVITIPQTHYNKAVLSRFPAPANRRSQEAPALCRRIPACPGTVPAQIAPRHRPCTMDDRGLRTELWVSVPGAVSLFSGRLANRKPIAENATAFCCKNHALLLPAVQLLPSRPEYPLSADLLSQP